MPDENKSQENIALSSPYQTLATNVIAGFGGGFLTGIPVTYLEKFKVSDQVQKSYDPNLPLRKYVLDTCKNIKMGSVLNFSSLFGCVVAIEYSVLHKVGDNYGPAAGVMASGFTGATFLTVADHMLYRNEALKESPVQAMKSLSKIGFRAFYAGFTPMCIRETGFTFAHGYVSQFLGMILHNYFHPEHRWSKVSEVDKNYQATGSLVSGPTFAFLTQYFDVITRHFQKMIVQGKQATWKNAHQNIEAELRPGETFWQAAVRGLGPRAGLCTFGGGTAFWAANHFKEFIENNNHHQSAKKL